MDRQRSLRVAIGAAIFLFGALLPGLALQPFHCDLPSAMVESMSQDEQSLQQEIALSDEQTMVPPQTQCPARTLPERQWDNSDLAMLSGCWHLKTDLTLHDQNGGGEEPVANWLICFDPSGHGTQDLMYKDGKGCTGPVQAVFAAQHRLIIKDTSPCDGEKLLLLGQWNCTHSSDSTAACTRAYTNDPTTHQAVFQR